MQFSVPSNPSNIAYARKLRKNMTKQERHLWYDFLRTHKFKWTRQKLIGSYIADFYSSSLRLVIELDGNQHATEEAKLYDKKRSEYFCSLGIKVLRFANRDIDYNFETVCQTIDNVSNAI